MAKAKSYRTSIPLDKSPDPADYNKDGVVTDAEFKRYKKEQKMKRKVTKQTSKTEATKKRAEKRVEDVGKDKDKLGKTERALKIGSTVSGIIGGIGTAVNALKNR
tara:strand:+ start:111 stop:425 length:315 start_codon:yes stop_codon:yes gene_type:complete